MRQVIREVPREETLTDIVDGGRQHCEKSEERYRLRVVSSAEIDGASGKMKKSDSHYQKRLLFLCE